MAAYAKTQSFILGPLKSHILHICLSICTKLSARMTQIWHWKYGGKYGRNPLKLPCGTPYLVSLHTLTTFTPSLSQLPTSRPLISHLFLQTSWFLLSSIPLNTINYEFTRMIFLQAMVTSYNPVELCWHSLDNVLNLWLPKIRKQIVSLPSSLILLLLCPVDQH